MSKKTAKPVPKSSGASMTKDFKELIKSGVDLYGDDYSKPLPEISDKEYQIAKLFLRGKQGNTGEIKGALKLAPETPDDDARQELLKVQTSLWKKAGLKTDSTQEAIADALSDIIDVEQAHHGMHALASLSAFMSAIAGGAGGENTGTDSDGHTLAGDHHEQVGCATQ